MDTNPLNLQLFFKIFHLSGQNQLLDFIMIFSANYLIILALSLILLLAFKKDHKNKKALALTILSFGVGFLILKITSLFVFEPRPFFTYQISPLIPGSLVDDSFPSDHSLILSIVTFSHAFYRTGYTLPLAFALILTGFARVFTGVHYPLDILGGILMGALAVSISWQFKKFFVKKFLK